MVIRVISYVTERLKTEIDDKESLFRERLLRIDTETIVQTGFVSVQDYSCDCCSSVFCE